MEKIRTYHIQTHGCQMNLSDSERIAHLFDSFGLKNCSKNKADLVVINSCSVRLAAENQVYGEIINLKKLRLLPKIIVTGCLTAKSHKKILKLADYVLNIKNLSLWPEKLKISKKPARQKKYFNMPAKHSSSFHAYVPISNGCDNFCTYCVVPYARGRETSRLPKEILREIEKLLKNGCKAITLVGQNVNSYGQDLKQRMNFATLLEKIEKLVVGPSTKLGTNPKSEFWVWFLTSHPKDMSDELIRWVGKSKIICPYIHLPAQHGDNEILKKMNRKYTREKYLGLIKKIRNHTPGVAISTDLIVGFPGETRKQFNNTAKLMRVAGFDMAYLARYSPRPGTAAAKLRDNVSQKEKKYRHKILNGILRRSSLENNKKYLGKRVAVLIECEKNDVFYGKARTMKTVKINQQRISDKSLKIGEIVEIKIQSVSDFGLAGTVK